MPFAHELAPQGLNSKLGMRTAQKHKTALTQGKGRKRYSQEDLADALRMVREHDYSSRQASRWTGVPRRTISDHLAVVRAARPGPPTALSKAEEAHIARYLCKAADMGIGLTKHDVSANIVKLLRIRPPVDPRRIRWAW